MTKSYDKPRRVNAVSVIIFLMLAAALYAAVQFGPPYYRKWKSSGILSEAANKVYPKRLLPADLSAEFTEKVRADTAAQLRGLGISDPGLRVLVEVVGGRVSVSAEYVEIIKHPFVGKITTLSFAPRADIDAKGGD
jgi:hypothetical protein